MNLNQVWATCFLGILGFMLLIVQVYRFVQCFGPPVLNWLMRHLVLLRLFRKDRRINPTRLEILCHCIHLGFVISYDTVKVKTIEQAAKRTAQLAVIYTVPLLAAHQLSFVAYCFGWSLDTGQRVHASIGVMATIQGVLHSTYHLHAVQRWSSAGICGLVV